MNFLSAVGFCRELYSHTLFARYSYKQQTQVLGLGIQPAQAVREFFMGGWLEWYAPTTLLGLFMRRGRKFSCARGSVITAQSGEIEKYVKLRQRLGIDRTQFIICNPDLTDEQAAGLGSMYGLTFVNLPLLKTHLAALSG